jgi:hypothetical protein
MNDPSQWLDALQWPAMALTVIASWLVASSRAGHRRWGFWIFLASNAAWITWALPAHAPALVLLQVCLAVMNIRGARKTAKQEATTQADE